MECFTWVIVQHTNPLCISHSEIFFTVFHILLSAIYTISEHFTLKPSLSSRSNVNVIKCNWMQLKAPNHRTIVAKCTDLRHQEPGLQLKQRNDKGLRRAVQAIQYMFHVQAFLLPNLHQIVPQDPGQTEYIWSPMSPYACFENAHSEMVFLLYYTSWTKKFPLQVENSAFSWWPPTS